jgi:hypothetical protein
VLYRPLVYFTVSPGTLNAQVVGSSVRATVLSAAFSHPRTLMGDFTAVESAMKEALAKLGLKGIFTRAPVVLTHLLPEAEGGYTNVELRAFREAVLGAGAAQSWLLANHPQLSVTDFAEVRKHLGKSVL